jgi:hypothetical protein
MMRNAAAQSMLPAGAGGGAVSSNVDDSGTLPRSPFPTEELSMKKAVIVSVAILCLSTSAALAAKSHTKKPAAAPAATAAAPETHIFQVSDADKKLYAKNKREAGVK